jgi:aminobenzoyl-glutamate transport protein
MMCWLSLPENACLLNAEPRLAKEVGMTKATKTDQRPASNDRATGFLGAVERFGNKLPDPVFIFFYFICIMVVVSILAAFFQMSAVNPVSGEMITARSLLEPEIMRFLLGNAPTILTGFAPLGLTLVVMLGAGVAERSGFFSAGMRAALHGAPARAMTPVIVLTALVATHSSDAAYVVLIPLSGVVYAAVGRHPIAGISAAFAGVSGGFSANLLPGPLDALILGVTEPAAQLLDPSYSVNVAGNWWFIIGMSAVFLPIAWLVTDLIIEPRLGAWRDPGRVEGEPSGDGALRAGEAKGLRRAGIAALLLSLGWIALTVAPGAPLFDPAASGSARFDPLFDSLILYFCLLFLFCGAAFGSASGSVRSHRDLVEMMTGGMRDMAPYVVLAFFAAYFITMFNQSNLGAILAIDGAKGLQALNLPAPVLLAAIVLLAGLLNLVIGSASAKWLAISPIVVPMLMILGISPEMTTAAYRVGDSTTNIITPLMVYFPLVLAFCRRWDPDFGMGGLLANMLPYSFFFTIGGMVLVMAWVALGIPPGPESEIFYTLPVTE